MARKSLYGQHRMAILAMLQEAERSHGQSPSIAELAASRGVGLATMHDYLKRLSTEGMVQWRLQTQRSLRLTPLGVQALSSSAP